MLQRSKLDLWSIKLKGKTLRLLQAGNGKICGFERFQPVPARPSGRGKVELLEVDCWQCAAEHLG
jgi:hypothetical protein